MDCDPQTMNQIIPFFLTFVGVGRYVSGREKPANTLESVNEVFCMSEQTWQIRLELRISRRKWLSWSIWSNHSNHTSP